MKIIALLIYLLLLGSIYQLTAQPPALSNTVLRKGQEIFTESELVEISWRSGMKELTISSHIT